jgi:hypothetical protein
MITGFHTDGQHVIAPYKGRNKPQSQKDANRAHARLRPGAQLKYWRIPHKLPFQPSPSKSVDL